MLLWCVSRFFVGCGVFLMLENFWFSLNLLSLVSFLLRLRLFRLRLLWIYRVLLCGCVVGGVVEVVVVMFGVGGGVVIGFVLVVEGVFVCGVLLIWCCRVLKIFR